MKNLPYNIKDTKSILDYAKKLEGKTLRQVLPKDEIVSNEYKGKGGFGQFVEKIYFKYNPNSDTEPDFPDAGIELKTTGLKKNSKGWRAKERLSLSKINFFEDYKIPFFQSRFWKKNGRLLLLFYVYQKEIVNLDLLFKLVCLWEFPEEDVKTIQHDFNIIIGKIKSGKAHEISEGDTNYLGASTKGSTRDKSMTDQPFSKIKARGRAFSLKPTYLNIIIEKELGAKKQSESIVKKASEIGVDESFEAVAVRKFQKYIGKSDAELFSLFGLASSSSKSRNYLLAKAILGVSQKQVEEFEKADISIKTVRLEANGKPKESMSFAQIKFKEIVDEQWEDSYWHEAINKKFFFVVFQKDNFGTFRLKKVFFWTMPYRDRQVAMHFWVDTRNKIKNGDFNNFIKMSDDKICHVRPKAKNAKDVMETHLGTFEKKKCYWLNRNYIADIIEKK